MASVYIYICIRTYIHVYVHINLFLLICMYKCAGNCPHQASSQWMTNSATKLLFSFYLLAKLFLLAYARLPFANQPNSFFGNFIFRIGTVWLLPACQILDLGMFYLAEATFRSAGKIQNSKYKDLTVI